MKSLNTIARALVAPGKGILAADESIATATKRLENIGVVSSEETRRQYRELFFTTTGIESHISGVILFDETFRQATSRGVPFATYLESIDVIPGIKVDRGTIPLPGSPQEHLTTGLDGLPDRLTEYSQGGCKFTKWRSVIRIDKTLPSKACLEVNAIQMAMFASISQQAGMLPIIEPEVLYDGGYTISRCEVVMRRTLKAVFDALTKFHVDRRELILKTSMVLPGNERAPAAKPEKIAMITVETLMGQVPAKVPGIVFLSGGQSSDEAVNNLRAITRAAKRRGAPWELSFSFARALQQPALEIWRGKRENVPAAQIVFYDCLMTTADARDGW